MWRPTLSRGIFCASAVVHCAIMRRKQNVSKTQDASKLHVGIVVSRYNADITENMLRGAQETLFAWGAKEKNVSILHVPGSFELPFGCSILLSRAKKPDALIALGCIVKGETEHDRHIASAVSQGLMNLSLATHTPISFGVLTVNKLAQARVRSRGKENKGAEAAAAALHMALAAKK